MSDRDDPTGPPEPAGAAADAASLAARRRGLMRARATSVEVPMAAPQPETEGAEGTEDAGDERVVAPPRLARYLLDLPSGREVGVAICGRGVPLVVIHGFGGEAILYAQTLSRLVRMGYLVIAIDAPGHGHTGAVPLGSGFGRYTELLAETLDHLGVQQAIFVGHSMGGRVVTELAAEQPDRVLALVLVDAIVGEVWDRMIDVFRVAPPVYGAFGLVLVADAAATLPVLENPIQALKLVRLLAPTSAGHLRRPWRLAGPVLTVLRAHRSAVVLDQVEAHGIDVFFVHGDRDALVPLCNARRAAAQCGGHLVTVHRARHSWLLSDPETFPALLAELGAGPLGAALQRARGAAGIDPEAPPAAVEAAFCRPGAAVFALTPDTTPISLRRHHRAPRYRWTIERPAAGDARR